MPGASSPARLAALTACVLGVGGGGDAQTLPAPPNPASGAALPPPLFQASVAAPAGSGTVDAASTPGATTRGATMRGPAVPVPAAAAPGLWPLTLNQAIAVALRNSDVVRTVGGGPAVDSGTGFDPDIARQAVTAAEAAFDPAFATALDSSRFNLPPDSIYGPGLSQPDRRNQGNMAAGLTKRWGAGTVTGVGYAPPVGYLFLPNQPRDAFNPLFSSNLEFTLRQPLLRGFGPAVNEAPIRVARINADQTALDLRAATQQLVRGVEETYWQLYAAGQAAAAAERSLALAREIVRIQEERVAVERAVPADVARAKAEVFRFEQLSAEGRARFAVAEVQLRDLLGLSVAEGGLIVAASEPENLPALPDRAAVLADAMSRRPDLARRRYELERRSVELTVAENGRMPQFDVLGLYRTNGVGGTLGDSLQQTGTFGYTDWTAGVAFAMPLGNRAPKSAARAAELAMARERAVLRRTEQAVTLEVERLLRQIEFTYARYQRASWQAEENREWLRAARVRFADPPPEDGGEGWLTRSLTELLLAMRTQAESEAEAASLLADHATLLARLEEAKGTILENRAVEVVDGEEPAPGAGPSSKRSIPRPGGDLLSTVAPPAAPPPEPPEGNAPAVALPPPAFGPTARPGPAVPEPVFEGRSPAATPTPLDSLDRAEGTIGPGFRPPALKPAPGAQLPPPVFGSDGGAQFSPRPPSPSGRPARGGTAPSLPPPVFGGSR